MTSLKAHQQGHLDSLCGLYSVINAAKAVRTNLSDHDARELFNHLCYQLQKEHKLFPAITDGLSTQEISRLLKSASIWLNEKKQTSLVHKKPFHKQRKTSWEDFIECLSEHLSHKNKTAIVGISGRFDHWTIPIQITPKRIIILDSDGRKHFPLSLCNCNFLEENPKHYHFHVTQLFLISAQ